MIQPSVTMRKKRRETKSIFYQFKGCSLLKKIFEKWSKNNFLYVTCSSARDEDGYHTTFQEQAQKARFKIDCVIVLLLP